MTANEFRARAAELLGAIGGDVGDAVAAAVDYRRRVLEAD